MEKQINIFGETVEEEPCSECAARALARTARTLFIPCMSPEVSAKISRKRGAGMEGHRERLISCGLYKPLSSEEVARRDGIVARMADSCVRPDMCVFRSDGPFTHVLLGGDKCCKDAELIAEKLTYWEASQLCNQLNWHDTDLPLYHPKSLYRQSFYKICSREDWDAWVAARAQLSIFDEEV